MNWRIVRAIAVKDWKEVLQNRLAWMPMLVLPIIFAVVFPLIFILIPQAASQSNSMKPGDVAVLTQNAPPSVRDQLAGLNDNQIVMVLLLGYLFSPLFLMLPLMTSTIIGADSFAGEKERKTMEALLYTPATQRELFFGKMLAALIPALLIAWGSFIVYTVILDTAGANVIGRVWFPTPPWWPLMLWVTPAVAVAGNMASVVISARVSSFMASYQMSSALVLPIIVLIFGQVGGILFLGVEVTFLLGVVVWLVDGVLLWFALKIFSRARLMGAAAQNQG